MDKELYQKMIDTGNYESPFDPVGSNDILSKSLETSEPLGHSRGVGVSFPHKRAFPTTDEQSFEKKRLRAERKEK